MAKDSFYFSHDYNARNDEKILELRSKFGAEGYGLFWMIVETMAENESGGINRGLIAGLSLGYGVAKATLSSVINECLTVGLFVEENNCIFSNRLLRHKNGRKSLSESGKKGAKNRWGGYSPPNSKERKGKEINRGVKISADGLEVFFEDGSHQKLGQSQQQRFKEGGLEPHFIKQGVIE
jgi:Domain of unknown function (DUF4373)